MASAERMENGEECLRGYLRGCRPDDVRQSASGTMISCDLVISCLAKESRGAGFARGGGPGVTGWALYAEAEIPLKNRVVCNMGNDRRNSENKKIEGEGVVSRTDRGTWCPASKVRRDRKETGGGGEDEDAVVGEGLGE